MKKNKLFNIILLLAFAVSSLVPATLLLASCSNETINIKDTKYYDSLSQEKTAEWFYEYDKYDEVNGYTYVTPPIYNIDYTNPEETKKLDAEGWMKMDGSVKFEEFFINKDVANFFLSISGGEMVLSNEAKNNMSDYFNKSEVGNALSFGPKTPGEYGIYYYDNQKENSIKVFANPYFCEWLKDSNIKKIDLSYNDLRYFPNMALAGATENISIIDPITDSILPYDKDIGFEWINLEHNKLAFLDFNMAHLLKKSGRVVRGKLQIDYNYMPYIYHQGTDGIIPYRSTYQFFDSTDEKKYIGDRVTYTFVSKEGIVESIVAEALKIGLFQKDGFLISKHDFYNYIQSINDALNSKSIPSEIINDNYTKIKNYLNMNFLTSQNLVEKWATPGTMYPEINDVFKINMIFYNFADNYSGECIYTFACNSIYKFDYNFASIDANITSETTVAEILEIVRQDYNIGLLHVEKIDGFKITKFLPIILIGIFGSIFLGLCGLLSYEFIYLKSKNKKRIEIFNKKNREKK